MHAQLSIAEDMRVVLREIYGVAGFTCKEQRLGQPGMLTEKTRKFKSGVSGRANDRGLELLSH
jgi:hypothetical protein